MLRPDQQPDFNGECYDNGKPSLALFVFTVDVFMVNVIYHDLSSFMIYLEIISTSAPSDLMTDGSEYMGMI